MRRSMHAVDVQCGANFSNRMWRGRSSLQAQQTSSTPARHSLSRSIVRPIKNFSSAAKPPVLPLGTLERGLYREWAPQPDFRRVFENVRAMQKLEMATRWV
jgi:hypothetical protein